MKNIIKVNLIVAAVMILSCAEKPAEKPDYSAAEKAYRNAQYDSAIVFYKQITDKFPEEYLAYFSSGSCKFNLGDYQGAAEDYSKVIEIREDNFIGYDSRGNCYFKLGDLEKAESDFKKSIKIKPIYADAISNLGYLFFVQGENDSALFYYDEAIGKNPRLLPAYFNRATLYDTLGQYQQAVADLNEILKIDSLNAVVLNFRGKIKLKAGDKKGADEDFKKSQHTKIQ